MPARVKKIGDKYRVVEPDGSIITNKSGTAVDGGGHTSKHRAAMQAAAINMSQHGIHRKKKA
jgi:hypothetical protein